MYPRMLWASSPGPTENLSIFDPVSPPADSIRSLSILVLVITGCIFLVVEIVLFYSILRFRRRGDIATEPPQVYGSMPIEIAWTAAPALIVVVLILITTRTLWDVYPTPPAPQPGDNTLFVTVVGRQWWWEYRYQHYHGRELGFITANELHIPTSEPGVRRPIYLWIESADVCHSFWVPRLAGKIDLIPGRTNSLWFETDKPGLYLGQCAEYCGTQHAGMLLRVIAEPKDDFERWLQDQKNPAVEDPKVRASKAVFLSLSCVNCHRIRGTSADGGYAPDLTHLMSRQTIASGTIKNDEANLREWIRNPQSLRPGCLMPSFQLNDRELALVVEYLRTLK